MKILKSKKTVVCLVMALMMIFSSMTVFASVRTESFPSGKGSGYINVYSTSGYAETSAANISRASDDNIIVEIRAYKTNSTQFDYNQNMHTGSNYKYCSTSVSGTNYSSASGCFMVAVYGTAYWHEFTVYV